MDEQHRFGLLFFLTKDIFLIILIFFLNVEFHYLGRLVQMKRKLLINMTSKSTVQFFF